MCTSILRTVYWFSFSYPLLYNCTVLYCSESWTPEHPWCLKASDFFHCKRHNWLRYNPDKAQSTITFYKHSPADSSCNHNGLYRLYWVVLFERPHFAHPYIPPGVKIGNYSTMDYFTALHTCITVSPAGTLWGRNLAALRCTIRNLLVFWGASGKRWKISSERSWNVNAQWGSRSFHFWRYYNFSQPPVVLTYCNGGKLE